MLSHNAPISAVKDQFKTDLVSGLTSVEAESRLINNGENVLRSKKKKSIISKYLDQFKDVMIIILIIAAIISFSIAIYEGDNGEFFEPILILVIVILNAILGVVQENKAEKALDALKCLSAPRARIIRDGEERIVDAITLVVGDIIKLEAGDFVPADARLIASSSLKVEESALTGESLPSEKNAMAEVLPNASVADMTNTVFSGCSVVYGTGIAVVVATGMDTEVGRIANLLENKEETSTPLQAKLASLGKYLGIAAIFACAVIFVVGLINNIPIRDIFMTSISLAVSAIPEGLPAVVTIVLAIGVQRMVKRNVIIRRLPAVETLGSASVICSDKTGTLTQNRMTLVATFLDGEEEDSAFTDGNVHTKELIKKYILCSNGAVSVNGDDIEHIGDPTETAVIYAGYKLGINKTELTKNNVRLHEIPFDSERKLMTTINEVDGKNLVIVKGAYDEIEKLCIAGNLTIARQVCEDMSSRALRVIAIAIKEIEELQTLPTQENMESNLIFCGLVGMIDPPRPEAKIAVAECRSAGIKPVMITGDHVITAGAIARELGILREGEEAITGSELAAMSEDELNGRIRNISVYARVSPADKIRVVRAWQNQGEVVAMTGDGVNDAPALKAADIGCAMGITGTDVAKGAADMTLTDDNFATIVYAVREGRGVYANIKKVVGFLLGTNIGEVITVFLAMLLWHQTPLLSMQLLWINLATDSFPAIALGMEAVESDIMLQKPKPRKEGIFANGLGIRVVLQGIMFAALTLIAFDIGKVSTGLLAGGQTMAFVVLATSQVMHAFNMRSEKSIFKIKPFSNSKLNIAVIVSLTLVVVVAFSPVATAFGLIMLTVDNYLIALALSIAPLVAMETYKLIKFLIAKKSKTNKS